MLGSPEPCHWPAFEQRNDIVDGQVEHVLVDIATRFPDGGQDDVMRVRADVHLQRRALLDERVVDGQRRICGRRRHLLPHPTRRFLIRRLHHIGFRGRTRIQHEAAELTAAGAPGAPGTSGRSPAGRTGPPDLQL